VKYHWTPNQYLNNDSSQSIIAKPPTDFTYTITATSATCTPSVQSFFIKVNSAPSLTLSGDQISTPGAPIRLYAQSNAYNGSYEWMPQTTDDISCIYCRVTTFKPRTAQFIIAEITTPDGCKARDTLYLRVFECDPNFIFVPNTFTPNGDGNNEALYVRSEIISKLEYFRVFDRWGNIVFETADKNVGWDGNYGNKEAQSGVYVYSLSAICTNGNNIKKSGNVTLVR
jgi:gliding motility-associated-like protein